MCGPPISVHLSLQVMVTLFERVQSVAGFGLHDLQCCPGTVRETGQSGLQVSQSVDRADMD